MKKTLSFGFLLAAGLLALIFWSWRGENAWAAPNAVFKTIKGQTLALAELKGKPVLVTFWASDCPSCLEEIPDLIALHQKFSGQGLTIIAVAMDYDPPNQVVELSNARQLPYAVALDPSAELAQAFGNIRFTPTSFLIDKNGMVVAEKIGKFDLAELQEWLNNS